MTAAEITRRAFLKQSLMAAALAHAAPTPAGLPHAVLDEFSYGDVTLAPDSLPEKQFRYTQSTVQGLSEDAMLKPFRLRAGLPTPGPSLGGWYDYVEPSAESDAHTIHDGFCPGHAFGQWLSSMSRTYAMDRDPVLRSKVARLLALYAPTITPDFYRNFRFPAYVYDKLNIGLIDAYTYADLPEARELFARTTAAAGKHLPDRPLSYAEQMAWRRQNHDHLSEDFTYDESYTLPENLFLATRRGLGDYRSLAGRYLLNASWFAPLSADRNVLAGKHAYSYCNSLSSGIEAYLSSGDPLYRAAVVNGFRMIREQSFATGGWGPRERFIEPGTDALATSLEDTSHSFETPCGSYAHFKVARSLLKLTGDATYGDSIEQVLYNTILGARPLEADGRTFYYSNYRYYGQKTYHVNAWPCCSGTLPQVTADYRLLQYLRDANGLYVSLYLPSTLRFTAPDGAEGTLTQSGAYPLEEHVALHLELKRSSRFALRFRVPAWTAGKFELRVNGQTQPAPVHRGWAEVDRTWHADDRIQITFPMQLRLASIDATHPGIVALTRGPLVLFALGEQLPPLTAAELLAATRDRDRPDTWTVAKSSTSRVHFRPFTSLGDEVYSTYIRTNA